jgi:hypothetical protein
MAGYELKKPNLSAWVFTGCGKTGYEFSGTLEGKEIDLYKSVNKLTTPWGFPWIFRGMTIREKDGKERIYIDNDLDGRIDKKMGILIEERPVFGMVSDFKSYSLTPETKDIYARCQAEFDHFKDTIGIINGVRK